MLDMAAQFVAAHWFWGGAGRRVGLALKGGRQIYRGFISLLYCQPILREGLMGTVPDTAGDTMGRKNSGPSRGKQT